MTGLGHLQRFIIGIFVIRIYKGFIMTTFLWLESGDSLYFLKTYSNIKASMSYWVLFSTLLLRTRCTLRRAPYTHTELSYLGQFLPTGWGRFRRVVYLYADWSIALCSRQQAHCWSQTKKCRCREPVSAKSRE